MTIIKIKRGAKANLAAAASHAALAEPIWTTDTKELWLGNGQGGADPVGTVKTDLTGKTIKAGYLAVYKDTTGKELVPESKADFLAGYATESTVDSKIDHAVKNTTVASATHAATATNATQLGGKPVTSFVQFGSGSNVTDSYTEDAANKVVSAKGVKSMNDALIASINSVKSTYIPNSKKSSAVDSVSQDTVATSKAVHDVKVVADAAHSEATNPSSSLNTKVTQAQQTATAAQNAANTKIARDTYATGDGHNGGTVKMRVASSGGKWILYIRNDGNNA